MTNVKKCPVCNGRGHTNKEGTWSYCGPNGEGAPQEKCNACGGKGWVTI